MFNANTRARSLVGGVPTSTRRVYTTAHYARYSAQQFLSGQLADSARPLMVTNLHNYSNQSYKMAFEWGFSQLGPLTALFLQSPPNSY